MEHIELSATGMPENHCTTQAVMEEILMSLSGKINHNVTFPTDTAQQQAWLLQIFASEFLLACKALLMSQPCVMFSEGLEHDCQL